MCVSWLLILLRGVRIVSDSLGWAYDGELTVGGVGTEVARQEGVL